MEIETVRAFDAASLAALPDIRDVRQAGPRTLFVTVDDAGEATPGLIDAIARAGGEVAAVREHRPSFDEVFAALVNRHAESLARQRRDNGADTEGAAA
jgi:hypothetical protein